MQINDLQVFLVLIIPIDGHGPDSSPWFRIMRWEKLHPTVWSVVAVKQIQLLEQWTSPRLLHDCEDCVAVAHHRTGEGPSPPPAPMGYPHQDRAIEFVVGLLRRPRLVYTMR